MIEALSGGVVAGTSKIELSFISIALLSCFMLVTDRSGDEDANQGITLRSPLFVHHQIHLLLKSMHLQENHCSPCHHSLPTALPQHGHLHKPLPPNGHGGAHLPFLLKTPGAPPTVQPALAIPGLHRVCVLSGPGPASQAHSWSPCWWIPRFCALPLTCLVLPVPHQHPFLPAPPPPCFLQSSFYSHCKT